MEMMQSPQKTVKSLGSKKERKGKMAEKLRSMSIKQQCLMVERVIYADEELQEVPIEYQDMQKYMEEVSKAEKNAILAKRAGKMARGDGGWPSTAVQSS